MKIVYLITDGCYSDYHVVGVCTTREGAEELIVRLRKLREDLEDPTIEEYPLDEEPRKECVWRCNVDVDTGEVTGEWKMSPVLWGDQVYEDRSDYWEYNRTGGHPHRQVLGESTRGPKVARKIAFDKRTQIQAEREGVA